MSLESNKLKKYFCTLFDKNYLIKGVAMMQSLASNCSNFHIFVLCMDLETHQILLELKLPFVTLIQLNELEDDRLRLVKPTRGVAEYCWTLSPCLPSYILKNYPDVCFITYLDSDIFFYSSIDPIFDETADASIVITEHRFSPRLMDRIVNGRFCVQWVGFKRDTEGLACLERWREQCIEWCYYRLEDGKMGDQKYLDDGPDSYKNCHIVQHLGAGVAPWNYSQYEFSKNSLGLISVNSLPLIFYHFHQLQMLPSGKFDRLSSFYTSESKEPDLVYKTYENALMAALNRVLLIDPEFARNFKAPYFVNTRRFMQKYIPGKIKNYLRFIIKV